MPVNEFGQRRPSFSRPDIPPPEAAGTCVKCGGHTRAEEFDSWQGGVYARKRTYRCIQHGTRCPAYTVIVGQDGQEEGTVAKTKAGVVTCIQTREWCETQKAAIVAKHLAYKEVAAAAAVSASALAQGLNMHMSLSEATQGRIEQAIAGADPAVAQKVRKERASRKPKQGGSVAFMEPINMAEVNASFQRVVERVLGVDELLAEAATCELPTGTDKASDAPEPTSMQVAKHLLGDELRVPPQQPWVGSIERRLFGLHDSYYDLVQKHKDHDRRVTGLEDARVEMLAELEETDAITARRLQELEDRITQTYDHLTEHMANLQPLVHEPVESMEGWRTVSMRTDKLLDARTDGLDWWLEEQRRNQPPTPDELVSALSSYSDSQLAALVNAATARREMLKAMEAA